MYYPVKLRMTYIYHPAFLLNLSSLYFCLHYVNLIFLSDHFSASSCSFYIYYEPLIVTYLPIPHYYFHPAAQSCFLHILMNNQIYVHKFSLLLLRHILPLSHIYSPLHLLCFHKFSLLRQVLTPLHSLLYYSLNFPSGRVHCQILFLCHNLFALCWHNRLLTVMSLFFSSLILFLFYLSYRINSVCLLLHLHSFYQVLMPFLPMTDLLRILSGLFSSSIYQDFRCCLL